VLPIFGIVGFKSAGKDTAARYINETFNGTTISLARPLKDFCAELMEVIPANAWYGPTEEREKLYQVKSWSEIRYRALSLWSVYAREWGIEPNGHGEILDRVMREHLWAQYPEKVSARIVLQKIGTEFARAVDPDLWTKLMLRNAKKALAQGRHLVTVADVRFPNEVLGIKGSGGKLIRVYDPAYENTDDHESENALAGYPNWWYDAVVENPKRSIDQYYWDLRFVMNQLLPTPTEPIRGVGPDYTKYYLPPADDNGRD
jgi:hypothetical protein